MTVTVHLPDELGGRLAAAAALRGVGVDDIAAELVHAGLGQKSTPSGQTSAPGRTLGFAAVGASQSGRTASNADDMLAESFSRD